MTQSILHQRLQNHAGHDHIERFRVDLFQDLQLVTAEANHFNPQVVVDEIQFRLKRRKVYLRLQSAAENVGELDQHGTRRIGIKSDQGGDSV